MDERGFVKLAHTFIDNGAKNGNVDINSILYDIPSQSKTHLLKYFKRKRERDTSSADDISTNT